MPFRDKVVVHPLGPVETLATPEDPNRPKEDARIEQEREMVYVPYIQFNPLRPRQGVPAVHLGPAGDPWPHLQATSLKRRVSCDLILQSRSRTDETHLSPQHVQELGQLVQAPAPQKSADVGDTVVVCSDRCSKAF